MENSELWVFLPQFLFLSPFGCDSWAVSLVSDKLHHTLKTRPGSAPSKRCPGSLAQARRGTAPLCCIARQLGPRTNSATFGWQGAHDDNPSWMKAAGCNGSTILSTLPGITGSHNCSLPGW